MLLTGSWDLPSQMNFSRKREQDNDSMEDPQSDEPDVATEFDDDDGSSSGLPWRDDSESETNI